jgi:hypothetical protein
MEYVIHTHDLEEIFSKSWKIKKHAAEWTKFQYEVVLILLDFCPNVIRGWSCLPGPQQKMSQ